MLESLYHITQICYVDDDGVYKDGERVALDNTSATGYIRWNGNRIAEKQGVGFYRVVKPLVFVGCIPGANPDYLIRATLAALSGGGVSLRRVTVDKNIIAQQEGISPEQMAKFDGVAIVWVEYEEEVSQVVNLPSPQVLEVGIFDYTFDATFN